MKLFLPQNIFSGLLAEPLPDNLKAGISYLPSSLIVKELVKDAGAVGLIPTMDLLSNKEIFVSKKTGISFEEHICNSYIYYFSQKELFDSIYLAGDVSSVEAVLTKIMLKEDYGVDVSLNILTEGKSFEGLNTVVVGNRNFTEGLFSKGISLAEEITETLNLPFVNYVAASFNEESVKEFNRLTEGISSKIYSAADGSSLNGKFPEEAVSYIRENIASVIYEFDEQDREGIEQLIQLPFFHGMIGDIIDVKFAED